MSFPRRPILQTQISRNIAPNIPIISAAMDTVTESYMAIALSRNKAAWHYSSQFIHRTAGERSRQSKTVRKRHDRDPVTTA
jgi:IMP dehydrogenase